MLYLISQILVFLVVAAAIGFLVVSALRSTGSRRADSKGRLSQHPEDHELLQERISELEREVEAYQAELADFAELTRKVPVRQATTTYAIEDIEGIGPGYGRRLRSLSIETTKDLLERCSSAPMRTAIAQSIGVEEALVRHWTIMAELMRISGVSSQYSELLEASGVCSVEDLAAQDPDALAAKMAEVNERERLTRTVPGPASVAQWVEQAKK
jgi:predicted flap endonuclease-1-like 5' DNA nuclease